MTDVSQDLMLLRTAARQREWNILQDTLKQLLAHMDSLPALAVAAVRMQAFLPVFEAYYPHAGWVRELLLTVISYGSAPNELPESAVNQFPKPGCGNFIRAVLDTARAVQMQVTLFERYSHITNAIANEILAELAHLYYSQNSEAFVRLTGDTPASEEEIAVIRYNFWLDEGVAAHDTALWLAVADDLETKLL